MLLRLFLFAIGRLQNFCVLFWSYLGSEFCGFTFGGIAGWICLFSTCEWRNTTIEGYGLWNLSFIA